MIIFKIPVTKNLIVSEGNLGNQNRFVKKKRHETQRFLIHSFLKTQKIPELPCTVKMTRIAPGMLDEKDNLRMAFKWIADYIADYLIPGTKSGGIKDGDKRLSWEYAQEKGEVGEYAIKIEIKENPYSQV